MPLLNRFLSLLRPGALPALAMLLSAAFPVQAEGLLQHLRENGRIESKLPVLQRPDGLFQYLKWLLAGPVQAPTGLRAEAIGSPAFALTTVQLTQEGEGLRVRGDIQRQGFGTGYGHLDIDLLDQGHRLLSARAVSYQPNPVPMTYRGWIGRSEFSVRFDRLPPGLAIVRVRFHPKD